MPTKIINRVSLLVVLALLNLAAGAGMGQQGLDSTQQIQTSSPTVTAALSGEAVRFSAPANITHIRLEVFSSAGEKVFNSGPHDGNVLDWRWLDEKAPAFGADSYLCVVTVQSLSGKISRKLANLSFDNQKARLKPVNPAELNPAQTQTLGATETDTPLTIIDDEQSIAANVIAHDGNDGQITRTRGALSFRFGDFFSGRDKEQMRLTEEGNLGIGTSKPEFKLDVAGAIRARQGFVFNDGSILNVNDQGVLTRTTADGSITPNIAGTGSQNRIAKWTDNSGTLGDSGITETNSGLIGIGTPSPDSVLNIQGAIPSLLGHMVAVRTTGSNNGFGLMLDATGSGNNNFGVAVNGAPKGGFSWDNARQFIGFVNYVYSPTDFSLRLNSNGSLTYHDGASSVERFRITSAGNVGIGTNNPGAKLDVAGDINTSTQYKISTQTVLRVGLPTAANVFVGNDAGFNNNGAGNSFFGFEAGASATPTTDSGNTFIGDSTNGSAGVNSATAIGSRAQVTQSNSLVLGSIKGVNSATSSTNVGIGITAPTSVLHVVGTQPLAVSGQHGTNAAPVLQIVGGKGGNTDYPPPGIGGGVVIQGGDGGEGLYRGNGGSITLQGGQGADFFPITDGFVLLNPERGNVGIGTNAPEYRMDVAGRSRFRQNAGDTGATNSAGFWLFQNTPAADRAFVGMESDNRVGFFGNNGGGWGLTMNTQTGNVGIGTTSPEQTLHVNGLEVLSTGSSGGFKFRDRDSTSSANDWVWYSNAGIAHFWRPGQGDMINILSNGRVGIGTSMPDQVLSLGTGTASKPGGGSWAIFSDERLKNIKGHFTSGLKAVMQLQPLRYEYKRDNALAIKSEGEHIGFSAQAVQKIIPEAVIKNDKGYLLINNDPIMWTMLNAIKEQQQQISDQQEQIKKQQDALKQQQSQIELLKKLICSNRPKANACKEP